MFPAGVEARRRGVDTYLVRRAGAHDLDVELAGAVRGRLVAHVVAGAAAQQIEREGMDPFTLRTSSELVEAEDAGGTFPVARFANGRWMQSTPAPRGISTSMQLLMAIDIDLAVQGASMVFGGKLYARCTLECWTAARCPALDQCAGHIVICAACLEQEP
jgi:hypothetical protein